MATTEPISLSENADYTDMYLYFYADNVNSLEELKDIAENIKF